MNSNVIKFVAGGGKTTYSVNYLNSNPRGLYLAFTNSVIDEIGNKGYMAKTIDSLFSSFIIPKLCALVPIINSSSIITFVDSSNLHKDLLNVSNIRIKPDGKIFNKNSFTGVDVNLENDNLLSCSYFPNKRAISYIFSQNELRLTHLLREDLSNYLIKSFPKQIISLLENRFSYIIIDEAQDLHGYREEFAKLIYDSNIQLIILGDDNQNINNGGEWFESLVAGEDSNNKSYRCPEDNCRWIRENLNIQIYGTSNKGGIIKKKYEDILELDDSYKVLLYAAKQGKKNTEIINNWKGIKYTIKSAKGMTIDRDIVVIGKQMNPKLIYTSFTRTTKNVYTTIGDE